MESQTGASLIKLLDDHDELVYEAVSQKIQELGPVLIPDLEFAAKETFSPILHERVEEIIGKLQMIQLKADFADWINSTDPGLFDGAWLIARTHYPDLIKEDLWKQIKPLRDEIWLEISEDLTGLEKIRIMNTLFFGHGQIKLNEEYPDGPGNNYLNWVIKYGKANEHSLSLLYAVIAQDLGMPVYAVGMPDYPILSYVDVPPVFEGPVDPELLEVLFYINTPDQGEYHSRG
ncbi:MAG: transglutaminase family protein [Bacteroidales bacterium]|nr:transglutaminase family protein [Bacteroidales bacterium]